MRVTELHKQMLEKQLTKLRNEKYETKRNTNRTIIFRSDSKGRAFTPFINHHNRMNLI